MKVTVKAAGARLVIRDVLRRPLAEMEVGQVLAGLSRPCPDVIQVPAPHHSSQSRVVLHSTCVCPSEAPTLTFPGYHAS